MGHIRHTLQGLVFAGIGWQMAGIFAHWRSSCFLKDGYLNTVLVTKVEMYIYTSKHMHTQYSSGPTLRPC